MKIDSLDPRVSRLDLPKDPAKGKTEDKEYWETYEVFRQEKRGGNPVREGTVHAPNPEMALVMAKEQHGRRWETVNIWVVRSADIYAFNTEDDDMFARNTSEDKKYRNPEGFSEIRKKIKKFQEQRGKTKQSKNS